VNNTTIPVVGILSTTLLSAEEVMMMKDAIGIIGGMGPAASQLFYRMVTEHTEAVKDQEHINMVILSDASMPDRTEAILNKDYSAAYSQLLSDARMLEQCGCKAVAVTCNTAHFFMDRIKDEISIPVIHMIHETVHRVAADAPGARTGVMATDGTIRTKLYQNALEAAGLEVFTPPPEIQKKVMYQIYDRIKKGLPYDAVQWAEIAAAYQAAGCKKVILACTELSVIKENAQLPDWYVDPMAVLAQKVIEFAGKKYKKE